MVQCTVEFRRYIVLKYDVCAFGQQSVHDFAKFCSGFKDDPVQNDNDGISPGRVGKPHVQKLRTLWGPWTLDVVVASNMVK